MTLARTRGRPGDRSPAGRRLTLTPDSPDPYRQRTASPAVPVRARMGVLPQGAFTGPGVHQAPRKNAGDSASGVARRGGAAGRVVPPSGL